MRSTTIGVQIDCSILEGTEADSGCFDDFYDAGGGGSFTLEATPDNGSFFEAWAGDCTGANATCTLSFTQAEAFPHVSFSVTATFTLVAGPATLVGTMYGGDGVTPLPGMRVRGAGAGATTDANGQFTIEVTQGGNFELFAQGVCDPMHPCTHDTSYNSTDLEPVSVGGGETKQVDLTAQRGYHLEILSGAADTAVQPGATFQLQLGYRVWSRFSNPGAIHRLAPGIDDAPGPTHLVGLAGAYPGVTWTTDLTLTAPSAPGDYGVYVFLPRTSDAVQAQDRYTTGFANMTTRAEEFIRVFTLRVCETAPNCP